MCVLHNRLCCLSKKTSPK
ncbi:BnaA01g26910D [Brassica napus]|uniref:BnaA01g26910D protein n=1 Tax=Brassica napus TaxID=3708 RepID=A0A078FZ85_BRANA|nr:BnaA01g26910D [Brassica napus]